MKQLWDETGYQHLGLKAQNLRDQASRLEKIQGRLLNTTQEENNSRNSQTCSISGEDTIYANSSSNPNLHTALVESPEDVPTIATDHATNEAGQEAIINNDIDQNNRPGTLPAYTSVEVPSLIKWGLNGDGDQISINISTITNAYNEISTWRKNAFLVPYGKTGKDFIEQITVHIDQWNSQSDSQHIALKAAFVLLAVGLQKPCLKSKAKDHQMCLQKRLTLWRDGKIDKLIREGRAIQNRLPAISQKSDPPSRAKTFAKLVMHGQINSALRYLSQSDCGGVLPLTDDVMDQLREKHPCAQPPKLGSLLFGPIEEIQEVLFCEIDGEMIRESALRTKGAGGPCGIDALGFKRILSCKSFKKSSTNLCAALATMLRRLCTEFIDPFTIEPLLASRLIPLDKGEGAVRPIGVGEVLRRIFGKCVTKVLKLDILDTSGSLQVCAGHRGGSEAAIHAMRTIFENDETDAVLLIDATNAFNALNRSAALHNIRVLCPTIAIYAINSYRHSARLFITGGLELESAEGTTQGDPLAMSIYAISLQPLITYLSVNSPVSQCWFADDACGAGSFLEIKDWWEDLLKLGPDMGYFPNAKKCWLITKPGKEDQACDVFKGTAVNVTSDGHKHLGAVLGSRSYLEDYVNGKVNTWINEVKQLTEFALTQPQASYAAFVFGLRHRWTYYLRTLPNIEDLLRPLEDAIAEIFIPSLTEHACTQNEREILALPVRSGGMGIINPCQEATKEFNVSVHTTAPLSEHIVNQTHRLPDDYKCNSLRLEAKKEKDEKIREHMESLNDRLSDKSKRNLKFASEKGASHWLNVIPIKEMDFNMNKGEFRDAIRLRYGWPIKDLPSMCVCGVPFNVDHAMICKKGGFVIQRHNELRDLEAELLNMVCNDVEIEPVLQDISGEQLKKGTNKAPDARLDVHARGFWQKQRSAFFDVRVCHPNAESYYHLSPEQIYRQHENEKKRLYSNRVLEVEQGSFTPLVFTTTGGMGQECKQYHCRLAELIANKKGELYGTTLAWIRSKVSFCIVRSAVRCLRGSRTPKRQFANLKEIDFDIEKSLATF